jgi:hypothetical protein
MFSKKFGGKPAKKAAWPPAGEAPPGSLHVLSESACIFGKRKITTKNDRNLFDMSYLKLYTNNRGGGSFAAALILPSKRRLALI